MKNALVSLKEYWNRVAVQAAQRIKAVAAGWLLAPVSRRLRARWCLYSRFMEAQEAIAS